VSFDLQEIGLRSDQELQSVALFARSHQIIVVNPTVPAHSLREEPAIASPLEFGGFIAAETQKWAAVIDAAGIKVD